MTKKTNTYVRYSSIGRLSPGRIFTRILSLGFLLAVLSSSVVYGQTGNVTGTVKDSEKGEPVIAATIVVKGKKTGSATDALGNFTISAEAGDILIVSNIGFESLEIPADLSVNMEIKLKVVNSQLGEVVVVGYGTRKRSDITGAVSSVPKSRLSQLPVTNILHAIEGAVAGVSITQGSNVPGSSASVLVRGQNTITAGTGPYIVVDGVPFSKTGSVTNDINPNDVASIEILKDASATAIYGVNGANGVILITTKRGTTGKPTIKYNGYFGLDNIAHILEPLSNDAYVQKYADWWKQVNPSTPQTNVLPTQFERANYAAGKSVDWLDEVLQQGIIQDHNVSISGGTKDVRYYLSGDYMNQQGAVQGYQYKRANFRTNLDANITDFLTIGTNLVYTNNNYDGGRANFYLGGAMSPYGSLYNANGTYAIYPMYEELLYKNPLLGLNTDRLDRSNNLNGNAYADVKFGGALKGLKYRLNAGYTYVTTRYGYYEGRNFDNQLGTANVSSSETTNWVVENILTYNKDWDKHHFDLTGLYSAQQRNYFTYGANSIGFINDELSYNRLEAGATQTATSYRDRQSLNSQMARVNYSYNGKYLFTATARRDGSSVMGGNTDKYGLFPSFAVGWNIIREDFMANQKFVNNLKLRGSYGKSGNEAIPVYGTVTTSVTNRFPFNGTSTIGVLASNLGNGDLHWEEAKTLNLGVDFTILNNRLNGTVDIYHTQTSDLLLRRNLPIITGYSNILDNLGETENKGIEITLNGDIVSSKNFKWQATVNFSSNKNEIVDLYGDKQSDIGNRWFIGQPISVIYDYKLVGVWQEGEDASQWDPGVKPGDLKFADINNDKKITADDRMVLGQTAPKWVGGLTNTFHFNNFHLNIFLQTFQGALRNNVTLTYADEAGRMNIPADAGYWTAENKSNSRPSLRYTNSRGYGYASDNSYTRIKDISLSYVFAQSALDKLKLGGLTLYVSGRNLYTFTNWVGWDPEFNYSFRGSGDWQNNYPQTRSFVFGVNVTLR